MQWFVLPWLDSFGYQQLTWVYCSIKQANFFYCKFRVNEPEKKTVRKQSKTLKHNQGKQYSKTHCGWSFRIFFSIWKKPDLVVLGIPYESNEQASSDLHLAEKLESHFEQLLGCDHQHSFVIKALRNTLLCGISLTGQNRPILPFHNILQHRLHFTAQTHSRVTGG